LEWAEAGYECPAAENPAFENVDGKRYLLPLFVLNVNPCLIRHLLQVVQLVSSERTLNLDGVTKQSRAVIDLGMIFSIPRPSELE